MITETLTPPSITAFASENTAAQVLIVDDENTEAYSTSKVVQRLGCQVVTAATAQEALVLLAEQPFDVMLIDIRLPDLSGLELLTRIKAHDSDAVVILTARFATISGVIDALRQGAADYLIKPVESQDIRRSVLLGIQKSRELKRRRTLLNTIQLNARELTTDIVRPARNVPLVAATQTPSPAQTVRIGAVTLYPGRYQIGAGSQMIPMTPTEFDLLMYLASHRGRVISCQELVREVRGYMADESEAREVIRPHVCNLRRKLQTLGEDEEQIVNVRGVGYSLAQREKEII